MDDQLLELVDDIYNFILDQIVHVKDTYPDRDSDSGRNPQYQHLRGDWKASSRPLVTMCMEFDIDFTLWIMSI